jgi:rSAM/selenodomain-associated transferase 2
MQLAIVVPVLNEAANIPALCAQLQRIAPSAEVVLVDGGSTDDTVRLARAEGMQVVLASRGRARQMNAGANATQAPHLLFLHADTQLPELALALVQDALQQRALQQHAWGRFDVRIQGQAKMLRVVAFLMNWRSRLTGIATGDQAMFMTRQAYDKVQGFRDQPLMEDIEMSSALKRISPPMCLRQQVLTSGRRWEQRGVWRTVVLMWRLRLAYWLGTPAEVLARAYR